MKKGLLFLVIALCLVTCLVFVACNGNSDDFCYINGVPVNIENFIEGVESGVVTSQGTSGYGTSGEGENMRYSLEKGQEGVVCIKLKPGYTIGDLQIKANGTVYDFVKDPESEFYAPEYEYYCANFGKVNGDVKIEFIGSTVLKTGSMTVLVYEDASTYYESSKLRFSVKLDGDESLNGNNEYSLYGLTSLIESVEFKNKISNLNQTQKLSIGVWKLNELNESGKEICIFGSEFVKFDCEDTFDVNSKIDISFDDETFKTTYTVTLYDNDVTIGIGTEYEYPENTAANYKLKQYVTFYSMAIGEENLTYIIDGTEYPAKNNEISLENVISANSIKLKVALSSLVMKLKSIGMFEKCFRDSFNSELTFTDNGDNVVIDLYKWYDNGITGALLNNNYNLEFTPLSGITSYDIFWENYDSIEGIKKIRILRGETSKSIYSFEDSVLDISLAIDGQFEDYFIVEQNAAFSFWVSPQIGKGNMQFTLGEDVFEIGISNLNGEYSLDVSALPVGYSIEHDTHVNDFKITVSAEKVASINVIE